MSSIEIKCSICHKIFPEEQAIPGYGIEKEIEELIKKEDPEWTDKSYICEDDLYKLRRIYIQKLVSEEQGQIAQIDQEVVNSIHESELLSKNPNQEYAEKLSFGNKISDKVAQFGGSWKFIISFFSVLILWIIVNAIVLSNTSFDPYPFILLNLVLSCIAAIQAPIIMMSQNRQEAKDRIRSENDYKVNLKAEIEIRTLHEKIDHLILEQWSRMMKIQNIQVQMMEEIMKELKKNNKGI